MKENYQKCLDAIMEENRRQNRRPTVLLHSCCAPCSSHCMELLHSGFQVTVLYYNPNITEAEEYEKRLQEQERLVQIYGEREDLGEFPPIRFMAGDYEPQAFLQRVKGLEKCPEGQERCEVCFRMRLEYTARLAAQLGFDYFTTTLTISPLKNAELLNTLGKEIGERYAIEFLPSDFKKKNGYQRSIALSRTYQLYRQDYCGCIFSKVQREREKELKEKTEPLIEK